VECQINEQENNNQWIAHNACLSTHFDPRSLRFWPDCFPLLCHETRTSESAVYTTASTDGKGLFLSLLSCRLKTSGNRLSAIFWFWRSYSGHHNSCIRREINGKWSLLKEQHKSFASLGLPLFLSVLHISFGSILLVFHQLHPCGIYICLVRLLMTAGYRYGRKSGHSHCVGTDTIIWKKIPYKWIFSLLLFRFPINPTYSLPVHFSSLVNFTFNLFLSALIYNKYHSCGQFFASK